MKMNHKYIKKYICYSFNFVVFHIFSPILLKSFAFSTRNDFWGLKNLMCKSRSLFMKHPHCTKYTVG